VCEATGRCRSRWPGERAPLSFYFAYQAWLSAFMPLEYTPLVLLAAGALLITGGAAWGPETKDVDFHKARTPEQ
jgi:hypothetical protein